MQEAHAGAIVFIPKFSPRKANSSEFSLYIARPITHRLSWAVRDSGRAEQPFKGNYGTSDFCGGASSTWIFASSRDGNACSLGKLTFPPTTIVDYHN